MFCSVPALVELFQFNYMALSTSINVQNLLYTRDYVLLLSLLSNNLIHALYI